MGLLRYMWGGVICNIYKNSDHELEEQDDAELKTGKWVIVQYCTKKTIKHYIGMLLARSEDDWIIKFTRGKNNEFVWPSSEDLDTVPECDI